MSIIDSHEATLRRRKTPTEESVADNTVLDVGTLKEILDDVCGKRMVEDKDEVKGFRHRDLVERINVREVLGSVTPEIFETMVNAMLKHHLKTITNSQMNGDWQLLDYDVEMRKDREGAQQMVIGVRWVDMNNETDLKYSNGQPAVNVTIENKGNSSDIQAMLEVIRSQQSGDPELKELVKLLTLKLLGDDKAAKKGPRKNDINDDEPL